MLRDATAPLMQKADHTPTKMEERPRERGSEGKGEELPQDTRGPMMPDFRSEAGDVPRVSR